MKRILIATLMMLTACATRKPAAENESTKTAPAPGVAASPAAQDPKVFNAPSTSEKVEFIPHVEEKPMKSYLAMNLPYAPYKAMYEQLQKAEGLTLNSRGEAHITVITPVEYDKALKKHLSIAEINKIAENAKIQETSFTPVCIGKGQKTINGKMEKVYYMVVESQALIDLRGAIEDAYVKNGGKAQDFVPERFFPHVTLGYTARDLHIEDGVTKNKSSCLYRFK